MREITDELLTLTLTENGENPPVANENTKTLTQWKTSMIEENYVPHAAR